VRWLVRQVEVSGAERAAAGALQAATTAEVEAILEEEIANYVDLNLLRAGRLPGVSGSASFTG